MYINLLISTDFNVLKAFEEQFAFNSWKTEMPKQNITTYLRLKVEKTLI